MPNTQPQSSKSRAESVPCESEACENLTWIDPRSAPTWVNRLVAAPRREHAVSNEFSTQLAESSDGSWSLVTGLIPHADEMDDKALRDSTVSIYSQMLEQLSQTDAKNPVRAWNLVPSIHRSQGPGQDRYMAFNAGRHEAYLRWFGCDQAMAGTMPTASALGYRGADLVVHLIGHHRPGQAVENPRQVPAFRYSSRYGKVPPSFVRATVLPDTDAEYQRVLVAGTASVVGEDSHHPEDLGRQLKETFCNLAAVLFTAAGKKQSINGSSSAQSQSVLKQYRSARVYLRRREDLGVVAEAIRSRMPGVVPDQLEFVHADICRPELLVEIEGVALLPHSERVI